MPTTGPPRGREVRDRLHHGREAGDSAGAQVVAVGEAAGDDHRVDALRARVAVPEDLALRAELLDREDHVLFAVRAREQDDADAFGHQLTEPARRS